MTDDQKGTDSVPKNVSPRVPSIEREIADLRLEIARLTAVVTRLTAQRGRRMDGTDIVICVLIVAWAAMVVLPLFVGGGS